MFKCILSQNCREVKWMHIKFERVFETKSGKEPIKTIRIIGRGLYHAQAMFS